MSAYPVRAGFWGKLPARGDFVRHGLSRGFTDAWDAWMSAMLSETQDRLGGAWRALWQVAPVWRFCLRPGLCGPAAAIGVWMPSVDHAGRAYPLTFAAEFPAAIAPGPETLAWMAEAEGAGRAALAEGLVPHSIALRLPPLGDQPAGTAPLTASWWWSEDKPGADPSEFCLAGMPGAEHFSAMLGGARPA